MYNAFMHLNWLAVVVTAVIGFMVGWLWFSPLLFVRVTLTCAGSASVR